MTLRVCKHCAREYEHQLGEKPLWTILFCSEVCEGTWRETVVAAKFARLMDSNTGFEAKEKE